MTGARPAGAATVWGVAAAAAFAGYLLTPTSARLLLNGIPLTERAELLGFLGVAVVAGVALVAWALRLRAAPAPAAIFGARASRWVQVAPLVGATALLVGLSLGKLAFPPDSALPLCLRSPEVAAAECLWSPEGRRDPRVTRYEDRLWFDAAAGRSWRLGYLNTSATFNIYGHQADTPMGRRQDFRQARANPFEARVTLPPHLADLLARDFSDADGLVWFSVRSRGALTVTSADGVERHAAGFDSTALEATRFAVPRSALDRLTWVYRNYECVDGSPTQCAEEMTFRTIRHSQAVLDVRVMRPGRRGTVPLGYGHLLRARGVGLAVVVRWLETVALSLLVTGAIIVPIAGTLTTLARRAVREMGARTAVAAPVAALALSALAYVAATGRPAWGGSYATLFDPGVSFWLTLPGTAALLLATTRPAWRAALGAGVLAVTRAGLGLWLVPFVAYALLQVALEAPASDEATLWTPGNDNLTWASRGKDVLRHQTLAWAFASIAKSAFPYLRALGYLLLGEGERFTSVAVGVAFLVVYGIAAYSMFQVCVAAVTRAVPAAVRVATLVLYPVLLYWLAEVLLAYGANHAALLFTEGPAWVAFVLSVVFLLRIVTSGLDGRLVAAVGVTFAASVLGRSNLLVWAPVFLVAPLALASGGRAAGRTVLRGVLLPLTIGLGLAVAHATIVGAWGRVGWYLGANTSLRSGTSLVSMFDEPLHRLVPTRAAALQLLVFGALYVAVVWTERRAAGRWTADLRWLLAFGGALALCGFVLQVPLLPAPYYPRTIVPTYFFLIILLPAWLDRWSRWASGATGLSPERPTPGRLGGLASVE